MANEVFQYIGKDLTRLKQLRVKLLKREIELENYEVPIYNYSMTDTLEQITRGVVETAYKQIHRPILYLKSGFFLEAFDNWPGVFHEHDIRLGTENILKLLEDKSENAKWSYCLGYQDFKMSGAKLFTDALEGKIVEPRGEYEPFMGSKFALIFQPKGSDKTFAQMEKQEYIDWISNGNITNPYHEQFIEWLKETSRTYK